MNDTTSRKPAETTPAAAAEGGAKAEGQVEGQAGGEGQESAGSDFDRNVPDSPWGQLLRSFVIVVGIPTLAALYYYTQMASDIYISESRIAIRTSGGGASSAGVLGAVFGDAGSGGGEDAVIVSEYIHSRDMLETLQERLDLRAHYSDERIDPLTRLSAHATTEDFLAYYRQMVEIKTDVGPGISALRVKAFTPEVSRDIGNAIIGLSEELVNRLSERITRDTLSLATRELAAAEARVHEASRDLTRFRNQTKTVNPDAETSAVLGIVTGLEKQLAAARAELHEIESFMRADSAKVVTLKSRIDALEQQVTAERGRISSEEDSAGLTGLIDNYQPLQLEKDLALQAYTSALTSLEGARAEAQRKQRYLIAFVRPELPDEALEPDRIQKVLTVLVAASLAFGIGALVVSAVHDHWGV